MYSGEADYRAGGAGAGATPNTMERGVDPPGDANVSTEGGRYYTQTPSPALQAVKKNINHISGLNLGLRVAAFVLSVLAFSLMASADQNGAVFSTFTSYSFLLAVNVLVVLYILGQIFVSVMYLASGKTANKLYLFITFGCDLLFAFLLMAAGAAGASVAMIINHEGVLDAFGNGCKDGRITQFCGHAEAAVAFTFLSFFCVVVSSLLGVYSLAPSSFFDSIFEEWNPTRVVKRKSEEFRNGVSCVTEVAIKSVSM